MHCRLKKISQFQLGLLSISEEIYEKVRNLRLFVTDCCHCGGVINFGFTLREKNRWWIEREKKRKKKKT